MNLLMNEAEWTALVQLIDDPDEEIYQAVSKRIIGYGKSAIPHLEQLWENSEQSEHQHRIDVLIRNIHFEEVRERFERWQQAEHPDLWTGFLILDQLIHHEDRSEELNSSLEQLRRNAWLELNLYLTPLEQINVLSRVLFEHNGFKGIDAGRERIEHSFVGDILLKRNGNQLGLGFLILVLAEKLDLPLEALQIPGLFVLGSPNLLSPHPKTGIDSIDFYMDPQTGELFGRIEIEQFLRRVHLPLDDTYFTPRTNPELVGIWLKKVQEQAQEIGDQLMVAQIHQLLPRS